MRLHSLREHIQPVRIEKDGKSNKRNIYKKGKTQPLGQTILLAIALLALSATVGAAESSTDGLGTSAHPIKVVITSLPPYVTKGADGRLKGIDGTLFDKAAKKVGWNYTVKVTSWDAMLAAVQAGRADLAVSDVAWTKARARTGLFTDPSYYLPELVGIHDDVSGGSITVEELTGKSIGAINGQSYVDPVRSIPGVNLRLYPDTATLLADLSSARIDVAFMDPLVMAYKKEVSGGNLRYSVANLTPPTREEVAAHPKWVLLGPQMIGWYVTPGPRGEKLVAKLNGVIQHFWENGTNVKAIKAAGIKDATPFVEVGPFWVESYEQQRRGNDRPGDWVPPQRSVNN